MDRQIIEVTDLVALISDIALLTTPFVTDPVRLVFISPNRGGPSVGDIRRVLASQGKLRLSGTPGRIFADLDPGVSEPITLTLDTIVRSDAAGLERMLLSVLPHVDEIVLGVDARSDDETWFMAHKYADCVWRFHAADIELSNEEWDANKIHFANARNLGRARVHAPWTLVLDTDEYLETSVDLRSVVNGAPADTGAFSPLVRITGAAEFEQRDFQRLARTEYCWHQMSHNQLRVTATNAPAPIDAWIISDTSLRTMAEQTRRDAQRDLGIEDLIIEAAQGNLNALFHVAKHRAGVGDLIEAVKFAEQFRLQVEPNSVLSYQRQWVALAVAFRYYNEDNFVESNRWACRALLDGPSLPALCLLGDIAEDEGDLLRARWWYEAACAVTDNANIAWPGLVEVRVGRLAGIRRALACDLTPTRVPRFNYR